MTRKGYLRIGQYANPNDYKHEIEAIKTLTSGDITIERANYSHELKLLMGICNELAKDPNGPHTLVTWGLHTLGAPSKDSSKSNLVKLVSTVIWMLDHNIVLRCANTEQGIPTYIWYTLGQYSAKIKSEAKNLGVARVKAMGQRLGRPKLSLDNSELLRMWNTRGKDGKRKLTVSAIAQHFRVSASTIKARIRRGL